MRRFYHDTLWKNFGAAIKMTANIVRLCPDALWQKQDRFYYMSYHLSLFLDYYLSSPVAAFQPLLPYTLGDMDALPPGAIDDVLPSRLYSRDDILQYLQHSFDKCRQLISSSTETEMVAPWIQPDEVGLHGLCPPIVEHYTRLEILFYNFRHVQHHVGQLNLLLRQEADLAADWIASVE